jgi:MFS family permease
MKTDSIQFLSYAAIMASLLFIPSFAQDLGASNFEVGLIVASYGAALFLSSYIFGRLADIHGRIFFLRVGLFVSGITFFLQIFSFNPEILLLVRILNGLSIGIFPAALISHVHDLGKSLGKFSSYGSLGWAFGSFLAGIISSYHNIFLFSSSLFFLSFLISLKVEIKESSSSLSIPFFPINLIRKNLSLYFSYFLRHLGATSIWAIFPLYLVELGANKFWIGVLFGINSSIQFFVMRYYADRFKGEVLVKGGLLLSTLVFFSYALATSYLQIIPIQILLAVSWSCLYVGSLLDLTNKNIEKATSVGILNSVISLSGIFGPIFAGIISEICGYREVMYFAIILSSLSFLIYSRGLTSNSQ